MPILKNFFYDSLRKSEHYFKTDMVYLVKNSLWLNGGQFTLAIISFVLSVIFANLLPPETYGTYKYILTLSGIIGVLSLSGLGPAIARAVAKGFEGELLKGVWMNLKWELTTLVAGLIGAGYYYLSGNNDLALGLLIVGIFAPIINSAELYGAFLNGRRDFKTASILNVTRYGIAALWLCLTVILTKNPIFLIFSYFFIHSTIVSIILHHVITKKRPNGQTNPETTRLTKHTSLINNFGALFEQMDNLLVFHYLGPAALAIYNFAQAIPEQLAGFIKNIGPMALPKFTNKKKSEIFKTIKHKSFQIFLLGLMAAIIYVLFAPIIFKLFFPQYVESIKYSQVYASILLLSSVLPITFLESRMALREKYIIGITSTAVKIPLLFFGIYIWGLWGLVAARILAKLLGVTIGYYYALNFKAE